MLYVEVVIEKKSWPLDKTLQYLVPEFLEEKIEIGQQVLVPLQAKQVLGYVVGFSTQPEVKKVKKIIKILSEQTFFDEKLLKLAFWMKDYYLCTLGDALHCLLPPLVKSKEKRVWQINFPSSLLKEKVEQLQKKSPKQAELLNLIANKNGKLSSSQLGGSTYSLQRLREKELIKEIFQRLDRNPFAQDLVSLDQPLQLNDAQNQALLALQKAIKERKNQKFLLHGITGSGKTEVYLQAIASVIEKNRQAIVLVPEISLTPQTVKRFRQRFGEKVAVWHSHLSTGERYDQWCKIKSGSINVVVGARSALFAPLPNLGMIIIDEEHESTYKQEENPKYHAREVAGKRIELAQGILLLATATPSLETYYRAETGTYQYLSLPSRVDDQCLPTVQVVDMREELKRGNKGVFSQPLIQAIERKILAQEQIILFLNRRGFSTFVICRECGLVLNCPNCDLSLTYHNNDGLLKCHYCQFRQKTPDLCPRCQSRYIRYFGTGTQKVEEELQRIFPSAKVLRMDADTTTKKDAHKQILNSFGQGKADILLGTQMIAKGLDFSNVTLVGVITADTLLNFPDFRAGEKTFQLLTQVAGRAGRGEKEGEVIIQTYCPEHYSIQCAQKHDFLSFYRQEIEYRKTLNYPPFSYLAKITIKGEKEQQVITKAQEIAFCLQKTNLATEILGPIPAPLSKIRGQYRWQIILKNKQLSQLREHLYFLSNQLDYQNSQVGILIDIEPLAML